MEFRFVRLFGCWPWMEVEMGNSISLKKQGVVLRMVHHPVGAVLGGIVSAAVCGVLGAAHGDIVAGVMAGLGAMVGAPLGAMLSASSQRDT